MGEARGSVVIGGHLGVGGGSCQMSCLSPPPPDWGELHVWAPCVAIATKASAPKGSRWLCVACLLHVYLKLWFSNKSFSLKVLFPNPGLMIEHWLSGALFCRLWFWSVIWITNHKSSTSPITVHPLIMLIMHLSDMFCCFFICTSLPGLGGLCSDGEKVSWLGAVCAADSDWNSAEALDCS